jgi:transcriptional regulator with XRE-family HTH domain
MNTVTRSVQQALANAPVSLRELARRTGISHVQLARVASGERTATKPVALAVVEALEAIAAQATKESTRVRRSLTAHQRNAE